MDQASINGLVACCLAANRNTETTVVCGNAPAVTAMQVKARTVAVAIHPMAMTMLSVHPTWLINMTAWLVCPALFHVTWASYHTVIAFVVVLLRLMNRAWLLNRLTTMRIVLSQTVNLNTGRVKHLL